MATRRTEKMTLNEKIVKITEAVRGLEPDTLATDGRSRYVSRDALIERVHEALSAHKVRHEPLPTSVQVDRREERRNQGGIERVYVNAATVTVTHRLVDLESQEALESPGWPGFAVTEDDWVAQKAISYSERAFFVHFFKITRTEVSVEGTAQPAAAPAAAAAEAPAKASSRSRSGLWRKSAEQVPGTEAAAPKPAASNGIKKQAPTAVAEAPAPAAADVPDLSEKELHRLEIAPRMNGAYIRMHILQWWEKDPDKVRRDLIARHKQFHGQCGCVERILAERGTEAAEGGPTAAAADDLPPEHKG